jgi:ferredoxin
MNMLEHAKKIVNALIESGNSNGVLGLIQSESGISPHLFEDEKEVDALVLSPKWILAKIASSLLERLPDDYKLSVICRGCDERALNELIKRNQVDGTRLNIIGMACDEDQAKSCLCNSPAPSFVDIGTPVKGVDPWADPHARAFIEGNIQVRRTLWQREFEKCIKCYGCRNACPLCNCSDCKLADELWGSQGQIPADPISFHLIRAFHLADICVGCGACQDACPVGIPLTLLQLPMRRALDEDYGYCAGSDKVQRSPLFSNLTKEPSVGLNLPAWTDSRETDHEN